MLIALDYDGTYTADSALWDAFVKTANIMGHRVVCFTMRHSSERIEMPCPVIYTGRKAKAKFAAENGYKVDVWVDNDPLFLIEDAA